ncbi:phosphopantetheine--protein transferase domain-containing protein [Mucilaginibacter pineti]|uniref:Phosphopantetheine--protein transferase domain-containing protein n=1 Tax=Mucilaginibacter pineti TaxID=1391627 RepID=A0A1G7K854_9SPHI|nr:4'-phosphopantetheinyl transferase superfamily protein [Mucilaginibacter pineti]SDF33049.1 phosphopantetheine--protein transferase domain-containing protein [Mucilaginibacter pineti]
MAIAYRQRIDDDTEFALWKIEEEANDLYNQLQLNENEKAYVEKLSNGKRHLHWLGTRVLLRKMLRTDEYIDCKVDNHGKPYLVNLPYHISLSHSFEYAAVMISKTHKVGIDIEQIKQKVERIASKFMRPEELAFINNRQKIEHLYVCWCAKEAIYKCNGEKEVSFADNIFLSPFNFEHHGILNANLHKNDVNLNYTVGYLQYQDYMIGYVKGDM